MVVNPAGPQPIFDGTIPRTLTARAAIGVTGGQLITLSGLNNSISSGVNSYATNDIVVAGPGSGRQFNGIVTTPGLTASGTNNYVTIATNGTWIVTAADTILAGNVVFANGADAVIGTRDTITGSYNPIGRALTPAGSEGYTAVSLYG